MRAIIPLLGPGACGLTGLVAAYILVVNLDDLRPSTSRAAPAASARLSSSLDAPAAATDGLTASRQRQDQPGDGEKTPLTRDEAPVDDLPAHRRVAAASGDEPGGVVSEGAGESTFARAAGPVVAAAVPARSRPALTEVVPEPLVAQRPGAEASDTAALLQAATMQLPGSAAGEDSAPTTTLLLKMLETLAQQPPPAPPEALPAPAQAGEAAATAPRQPSRDIIRRQEGEDDDRLVITTRDEDIRAVLEMLSEQGGLNILASPSVQGRVSANLKNVDVQTALNAILKSTGYVSRREGSFVYVGTPQDFLAMQQSLDRIGTRLIRPNYVTAQELQTLLTPLLTPGIGKISITSAAQTGITPDTSNVGGNSLAGDDAVVVQDYEAVLAELDQIVHEVDKRPAQVAIESMILSVKLDDEYKFGVDFVALRDKNHVRLGWGTPRQAPINGGGGVDPVTGARLGELQFDTGGLKFAFLDDNIGVFINALETVGDVNVIATPRLMCLNKQKAEILIGAQLGYISTTVTETSTAQNVEFLEVGAQLRLRPFISSDGLIRMEVHPELSTGQVKVQGAFTLPEKELTQVTTNIMCPDGCTVVIGGLMREDLSVNDTQVPLVGSLPIIGPLFRSKSEKIERREILVVVTPRIVYDHETCPSGAKQVDAFLTRQDERLARMSPITRPALSTRSLLKAQEAWAAGNVRLAALQARLAVHYDPTNNQAIAFRDMVLAAAPQWSTLPLAPSIGDESGHPLDGAEIAPWVLEHLEGAADGAALPLHPRDAGQPGTSVRIHRPGVIGDEAN